MTLAHWCILVAALLPMALAGVAKAGGSRYDNRAPRAWLAAQSGWRRRADWAQHNGVEAFAPVAAGVLTAHQLGADPAVVDTLAVTFIALRIADSGCSLADQHILRSLTFAAALAATAGLFIAAALA